MTINLPLGNFADGLKNKHVSIPLILMGLPELVRIWYPAWYLAHQQAIQATQKWLIVYAGIQASTTTAVPSQQTKEALTDLQNQVSQVKRDTATVAKPNP